MTSKGIMDPNKTLEEIRNLLEEEQKARYPDEMCDILTRLAGKIEDLDNWITNGGTLPEDWKK